MQKISPLRASLDAFNKFREARGTSKSDEAAKVHSNPFGITFKGTVLQMDVFEAKDPIKKADPLGFGAIQEKMQNVSKLTASAWVSTINKFSDAKNSVISFCGKIWKDANSAFDKLDSIRFEPSLDFYTHSVSNLQRQPIGALEEKFRHELAAMGGV